MAGDDRRPRAEDRAAATDLHRRRAARLRADGPALSDLVDRIREGYAAFNRGDFDSASERMSPDMEWVVPAFFPDPGPFRGPEGVRRFWEMWGEAFEEFKAEPQEYVEAGDVVVMIIKAEARGRSGPAVDTPSFPNVWTARDGVFVRMEMFASRAEALAAAGLPPDAEFEQL